jgi:hypothetical protein
MKEDSKAFPRANWSTAKKRSFNSQCDYVAGKGKYLDGYGRSISFANKQARYKNRTHNNWQPTKFLNVSSRLYNRGKLYSSGMKTKLNSLSRKENRKGRYGYVGFHGGRTRKCSRRNRTQRRR